MDSIREIQKLFGYKEDTKKAYKKFTSYYDEYQPYLRENKLYSNLTYEEFKEDLKHRVGMTEKCQRYADLMHTEGYNLGMAQKEVGMSFDEVSIAMDGMIIKDCLSYHGKEYDPYK